ncbi:dUTPase [compost metagenome]
MSVQQIKGRTTNSQVEFESNSLSHSSLIFTDAPESSLDEFSLELTLGNGWNDSYSDQNRNLIEILNSITIRRNGSIVVEVQEEIRVPHNKYGIVLPTGSMFLSKGVLIAPAKVEPSFVGKLKLRLFNTTSDRIVINKGTKLASIVFFQTESTKEQEHIYRKSEISLRKASKSADLKRWFSANKPTWIGWIISLLGSSGMALIFTYFLWYKPMLEHTKKEKEPITQTQTQTSTQEQNK